VTRKEERTMRLLELLKARGRVDVKTVAEELEVSQATVRRFFGELEAQGSVIRTHGGVQLTVRPAQEYSFSRQSGTRVREKTAIGAAAADLIASGDRIFLDSGSTVMKLAEALAMRLDSGRIERLVIVTNSLNVADLLGARATVILVGGEVRMDRRDVYGPMAERELSRFRVSRAMLGADAIDLDKGFLTTDERTARMDEIVIAGADQVFVLADSQKFSRDGFISYAPLRAARSIYTDGELDSAVRRRFEEAGARITLAPETRHPY